MHVLHRECVDVCILVLSLLVSFYVQSSFCHSLSAMDDDIVSDYDKKAFNIQFPSKLIV